MKYEIHMGVRYTANYIIEADSEAEAVEQAESLMLEDTPNVIGENVKLVWHFGNYDIVREFE